MDMVDNMRAIPTPGGAGSNVAPGTTAAMPRYSMGATGGITDNSLTGPTISQGGPFTMPGGAPPAADPGMASVGANAIGGAALGAAPGSANSMNTLGGGAANPAFYGR